MRKKKALPFKQFDWPCLSGTHPAKFRFDFKYEEELEERLRRFTWMARGIFVALMEYSRVRVPCSPADKEIIRARIIGVVSRCIEMPGGLTMATHYCSHSKNLYAWFQWSDDEE